METQDGDEGANEQMMTAREMQRQSWLGIPSAGLELSTCIDYSKWDNLDVSSSDCVETEDETEAELANYWDQEYDDDVDAADDGINEMHLNQEYADVNDDVADNGIDEMDLS